MSKNNINLLSQDDFSKSSLGKFSIWALSIGRWIVIITELIVVSVFLSRFKLDKDNENLKNKINNLKVIVDSYESTEIKIKKAQSELDIISQALDQQVNYDLALQEFNKALPVDILVRSININQSDFSVTASALTETGIAGLSQQLEFSPYFEQVNLTRINSEDNETETDRLSFEISAKLDLP